MTEEKLRTLRDRLPFRFMVLSICVLRTHPFYVPLIVLVSVPVVSVCKVSIGLRNVPGTLLLGAAGELCRRHCVVDVDVDWVDEWICCMEDWFVRYPALSRYCRYTRKVADGFAQKERSVARHTHGRARNMRDHAVNKDEQAQSSSEAFLLRLETSPLQIQ